ncbi:hypothetical protein DNTS_012951 [Danionella cerebrum]|uniref:BRCT domain-containing protein n=1 Tax=Danionella cerebrum TaxID=2873325 RepID=A0A553RID0_9TELE|nr:hypothetical protein DNTS_012951 [Danionella translucida]
MTMIPLTVTSTAAQEPIKDCFQDQVITSTESTEESRIQSCNITSSSPASKLSGASLPSGQLSELGDKDPDLDPNVLATDLLRGTELRAERQSSSSTLDGPEHEVHCGRGQCAALPAKEGFEEVGIQSQEVFPAVFSTDITSETELRSECHSSRAVSTSSACECTIHKLVFEVVRMDKCWICKSPVASVRWHECCGVWHKICLKKSSEDWDISDDDVSSGDEFIPESVTDSESSEQSRPCCLNHTKKNGENFAALTLASPHLSETAAQDDQENATCVTSGSPHPPDSVTQETVREEQGEPLCHNLTSTYSTFSTADTQLIATVKPEADLDEQRLDDSHLSTADNLLTASTPRREDETQSFPLFTAQTQLIWEEEGKEIDPTQLIEGDSIADNRKKELCIKEGRTSNPAETAQEGSSSSLFIAETQPMFEEEEATHSNLSVENFKIPRIQNWGVSEDPAHHVENISSSYIVIAETQLMYGEGEASNQEHKRRTISNGSMEGEKVYTPSACIPQTEPDCEETEPFLKTTWTSPQRGKYEKVKEVPQSDPTCEASSETPNKRRADDHKPAAETQALRVDQNEHVSTVISTREMDRESSTVTDEEPKEDKSLSRKTVNRRSRRVKPEPIQRASPETQLEKAQEGEEKELVENKRQRRGCEQREQGEKCQWQEQKDKKLGKEKADCSSSSLNSDQSATPEQEPRSMRGRGRGKRTSVKQPPNARQSRRLQETEQMVHSRSTSRSSERTADVGTSTQGTRGKSRGRIVKPQEVKVLPQAKAAGRRRRCSGAELLTMAEEDAKMVEDKSAVPQTSSRGRKRSAAPSEHDPSPTGKISRRTVASQTYKVLFTGLTDDDGERVVSSLGGTLAKGVSDMTHLVTDKARRTVKFLCAVARGVPIVTPDWLKKCGSAGRFLSTDDFILKDVGQEKKFNFCLQTSLQAALNQPLLKDYEIHVTPSVMPEPSQMKEIIMCCGGRFLQKMPSAPKEHVVVVSCEQDLRLCSKALSLALPVVTAEFLLSGILQQRVDLQAFSLASSLDSSVQPAASKPAATGRGRK